jgi:hypothetical protein
MPLERSRTLGGMKTRIVGAILGAQFGVVLILLADHVITGEWQLTIGTGGIVVAAAGAIIGGLLGLRSRL